MDKIKHKIKQFFSDAYDQTSSQFKQLLLDACVNPVLSNYFDGKFDESQINLSGNF